jgi:hypothetical protein
VSAGHRRGAFVKPRGAALLRWNRASLTGVSQSVGVQRQIWPRTSTGRFRGDLSMDRATLLDLLARAEQHMVLGKRRIDNQ